VEGDEAVSLNRTGVLLAALELIDQRNQVGAVVAPLSSELPCGIRCLVKNGRLQSAAYLTVVDSSTVWAWRFAHT
jgi:hypothetical protein